MSDPPAPTPLWAGLALTWTGSLGTAIGWSGVYFVTEVAYDFGDRQNLMLAAGMGLIYIVGALAVGPGLRRAAAHLPWLATRTVLGLITFVIGAVCFLPLATRAAGWSIWVFAGIYMVFSGAFWPIVESYVSGGRTGPVLRAAAGRFNLAWASALIAAMWAMAPLLEQRPLWVLGGLGILYLASIALLAAFLPEPGRVLPGASGTDRSTAEHRRDRLLLAAFRLLLVGSYLLIATVSPLLPALMGRLAVPIDWKPPIASIWMIARLAAFGGLITWQGWHGRGWPAGTALTLMLAGAALTFAAPAWPILAVGLALLGLGMGATYTGAFYYAMEAGAAEVEAGGKHEALIGVGYAAGPLVALAVLEVTT